jgi:hypothetical protein
MISASSSLPSRLFLRKNIASEGELHTSVDDSRVEFNGDGCADDLAEEARGVARFVDGCGCCSSAIVVG